MFWHQKARINWLKERDKNIGYLCAVVEGRRKRNNISTLLKEDGQWCGSVEEIEKEITGYFHSLFTYSQPEAFDIV